eukprot:464335_1
MTFYLRKKFKKVVNRIKGITPAILLILLTLFLGRIKTGWSSNQNIIRHFSRLIISVKGTGNPHTSVPVSNGSDITDVTGHEFGRNNYFLLPFIRGLMMAYQDTENTITAVNIIVQEANTLYGPGADTSFGAARMTPIEDESKEEEAKEDECSCDYCKKLAYWERFKQIRGFLKDLGISTEMVHTSMDMVGCPDAAADEIYDTIMAWDRDTQRHFENTAHMNQGDKTLAIMYWIASQWEKIKSKYQ